MAQTLGVVSHGDLILHVLADSTKPMSVKDIRAEVVLRGFQTNSIRGVAHRVRTELQFLKKHHWVDSPSYGMWKLA